VLLGYFITAPPSVCVPDLIGVLAVWIQHQIKKKLGECNNGGLIDTYVTVPIDVRTTLLTCLSSFSICIFVSQIPAYVYVNMYTHFSPLPYSYTLIAIFNTWFVFFSILLPIICFLPSDSTDLIDTYVTVPIDVRTTLLIYLSSSSICIFIALI